MGCVYISHNRVIMLVDTAERPEDIDRVRAEAALERAKEQLRQKQSIQGVPCIPGIHGESYAAPEGSRKIRDQLEIT